MDEIEYTYDASGSLRDHREHWVEEWNGEFDHHRPTWLPATALGFVCHDCRSVHAETL